MKKHKEYLITWSIDIFDSASPRDAIEEALSYILDNPHGQVFGWKDEDGNEGKIDLEEELMYDDE